VQVLELAGKIRHRPKTALTHLHLAELLLEEAGDMGRLEAPEHLDLAIPELQDMHMQPALERALAIRDSYRPTTVQASVRPPASDTLTAREREIAGLMADGRSNRSRSQQAEQITSARITLLVPVAVVILMRLAYPAADALYSSVPRELLLLVCGSVMLCGYIWMLRIGRVTRPARVGEDM
jgi:hypothetical protein